MSNSAHETKHARARKNVAVNAVSRALIFLGLLSVVLFTLLFTTYAPVHDFFHGLRHALMIIPCH